MKKLVQKIRAWFIRQRCLFKLFQLEEYYTNNELETSVFIQMAVNVFEGIEFSIPERRAMQSTEVSSKMTNVMTLVTILDQILEAFKERGELTYNLRLIADLEGYSSALDWYWNPMLKAGLNTSTLIRSINNKLLGIHKLAARPENANKQKYVNRTMKPILANYHSLIKLVVYLHIEN